MKNFIMNKKYLWINILLMICTYGIWTIIFLILRKKYSNDTLQNTFIENNYRTWVLKAVGVTFNNSDGSSRQKLIQKSKIGDKLVLTPYIYEDKKAVYIKNAAGEILGNIPEQNGVEITNKLSENKILKAVVEDIDFFTNENKKKVYYLKLKLYIKI